MKIHIVAFYTVTKSAIPKNIRALKFQQKLFKKLWYQFLCAVVSCFWFPIYLSPWFFSLKKRCCMLLLRIFCHYLLLIRARDGNNSCMRPSLAGVCKMSALYTQSCIIRFDKPFAIYTDRICTESHAQIWHFRIYLHIHIWHKKNPQPLKVLDCWYGRYVGRWLLCISHEFLAWPGLLYW